MWFPASPAHPIPQHISRAIAGSRFELFEGAGHFLPEERPEKVASLVSELVRGSQAEG